MRRGCRLVVDDDDGLWRKHYVAFCGVCILSGEQCGTRVACWGALGNYMYSGVVLTDELRGAKY
jgi:hypothetical protein